jgi:hypothetical protein
VVRDRVAKVVYAREKTRVKTGFFGQGILVISQTREFSKIWEF